MGDGCKGEKGGAMQRAENKTMALLYSVVVKCSKYLPPLPLPRHALRSAQLPPGYAGCWMLWYCCAASIGTSQDTAPPITPPVHAGRASSGVDADERDEQ
jgi:hypothetical protein